jgi:hypothetical protein
VPFGLGTQMSMFPSEAHLVPQKSIFEFTMKVKWNVDLMVQPPVVEF